MSYTMVNGHVMLSCYKDKMVSSNKMIINDVEKVREVKKALVQVLSSKFGMMELDEREKFFNIDAKLYSWMNNQNSDITSVVMEGLNLLKSYNKSLPI